MPLANVLKPDVCIRMSKLVWRHLMYCWLIDTDAGYMRVALWYTHKDAVLNFCDVGTSGFCLSFLLLSSLLIISRVCHVANKLIQEGPTTYGISWAGGNKLYKKVGSQSTGNESGSNIPLGSLLTLKIAGIRETFIEKLHGALQMRTSKNKLVFSVPLDR